MSSHGVAIIGAGMIGAAHAFGYRNHLPRFANRLPGLRLATVCDANQTLAEAISFHGRVRRPSEFAAGTFAGHPASAGMNPT